MPRYCRLEPPDGFGSRSRAASYFIRAFTPLFSAVAFIMHLIRLALISTPPISMGFERSRAASACSLLTLGAPITLLQSCRYCAATYFGLFRDDIAA